MTDLLSLVELVNNNNIYCLYFVTLPSLPSSPSEAETEIVRVSETRGGGWQYSCRTGQPGPQSGSVSLSSLFCQERQGPAVTDLSNNTSLEIFPQSNKNHLTHPSSILYSLERNIPPISPLRVSSAPEDECI